MRALRFTLLPALLLQVAPLAAVPASASAAYYNLTEIVRTGDAVPGGTGTFVSIAGKTQPPTAIPGEVLFGGKGSDGEEGLYVGQGVGPPCLVADLATPIPGGQGNFTGFGAASLSGSSVAFRGLGSGGQDGVYIIMPNDIVADLATPIPGGQGNFTAFAGVAFDDTTVAFRGSGSGGQDGVYIIMPNDIVADLATPIPGGQLGTFTAFSPDVFMDQGVVAFGGNGPQGYSGFFQDDGNGLATLVDTFTPVPGANGESFSGFEEASFVKGAIAFHGFGANGSEGVYIVEAIGPSCVVASRGDADPRGAEHVHGIPGRLLRRHPRRVRRAGFQGDPLRHGGNAGAGGSGGGHDREPGGGGSLDRAGRAERKRHRVLGELHGRFRGGLRGHATPVRWTSGRRSRRWRSARRRSRTRSCGMRTSASRCRPPGRSRWSSSTWRAARSSGVPWETLPPARDGSTWAAWTFRAACTSTGCPPGHGPRPGGW